jgi:hypothetical protein
MQNCRHQFEHPGQYVHTELDVGKTKTHDHITFIENSEICSNTWHLCCLPVLSISHCSQTIFIATVVRKDVPTDGTYKMVWPFFTVHLWLQLHAFSKIIWNTCINRFLQHWHIFLSYDQYKSFWLLIRVSRSVRVFELLGFIWPSQWNSGTYLFYCCIPSRLFNVWPLSLVVSTKFCWDEQNISCILPLCHEHTADMLAQMLFKNTQLLGQLLAHLLFELLM